VKQQARGMVSGGIGPEELPVEHVGEPRERMPEIGVEACEGPPDSLQRDPGRTWGFSYT